MSTKGKVLILALVIIILIGIVVIIPFVTTPEDGSDLSYEGYNKIIKGDNSLVYYGERDQNLTDFSEQYDVKISVLNPKVLSKDEKKKLELNDGYLYVYNKGKEIYNTDFGSINYKSIKELMSKKFIPRSYIEVNVDEYKELIKAKGYNVMFIGRATCGWCDKFKESIKTAMADNEFYIYYIDTDKLEESNYKDFYATDEYLTTEEWGTPLTFIYKDGKRINAISGFVESTELVDILKKNKVL